MLIIPIKPFEKKNNNAINLKIEMHKSTSKMIWIPDHPEHNWFPGIDFFVLAYE
jgi:hypothetical protein